MKAAIVILSDPKAGTDDALGRLFNGLATAYDFKQQGNDVTVMFQGAGTRWASQLVKQDHPAHQLYKAVQDKVAGISCGCADVFGAHEEAVESGFELISENKVPGTSGLPSLHKLVQEGFQVMIF